jgi:predicted AAA+ superfamily ATPase
MKSHGYMDDNAYGPNMKRSIENPLMQWKDDPDRKVLLVRGARQVGKTYSIRQLGIGFKHFLEVNFEEEPAVKTFFADSLNPAGICQKLSAYFAVPIKQGETLLFLDEIQACPNALKSLRFFHEKTPNLHVVAAGSLLEFAMEDLASFGVGRITSLFMYPMTFVEFLSVVHGEGLTNILLSCQLDRELDEPFHRKFLDALRTYWMVGGMPAVVNAFRSHQDLRRCQERLDALITSIKDDFGKYKDKANIPALRDVFNSIPQQAGGKFKYANVSQDNKIHHYKIALGLLIRAGLAHGIHHTSARGIPLSAQTNHKRFKVLPWDVGVYQRLLGLDLAELLVAEEIDLVNKGNLAELHVGLELIASISAYIKPELHYWHREARASNAEIDYVIQKGARIVPVEVKAGTSGQMQSMRLFLSERSLDQGICLSTRNFGRHQGIHFVPIYAAGCLRELL